MVKSRLELYLFVVILLVVLVVDPFILASGVECATLFTAER